MFDVKVVAKYPKNALKSETIINCQLTMPGTDYTKKQETVYYGEWEVGENRSIAGGERAEEKSL